MNKPLVEASLGENNYFCSMACREFTIYADEPIDLGGQNKAPKPSELLIASLASCTVITLKMYADRKSWHLGNIHVFCSEIQFDIEGNRFIEKTIHTDAMLTEVQQKRLITIADKCPVSKVLSAGVIMITTLKVEDEN